MTWLLDFIHARKWLVELILLGVIVAAIAYWHHATFQAGIQHQKDEDARELAAAVADRDRRHADDILKAEARSHVLATTLATTQATLDDLVKNLPKHAVTHAQPTASADPCPPLRLDPDWLRAYAAGSAASAVHYPH